MKRRKLHVLLLTAAIAVSNMVSAQLFIDQATFTIQSGATVTVQGDVTSNADILGTGKIILKGTANQNVNMGGFTVPNLEIDNVANATLKGAAKISGVLTFTNGNLILGTNNLTLLGGATPATITGASSTKFVVTNDIGRLVKSALGTTAFNYPVGNATTSYTPVSISNAGTADDIGVRAVAGVLTAGTTGTAFTKEVVNNTWDVSEAVAGGSSLSMTATWNTGNELPGFDRTRTGISYYIPTAGATMGWDLLNSQTGAATGTNPYSSVARTGITSLGSFAVGTRPVLSALLVQPKVFLQGAPYNITTATMLDGLRTNVNNLLPTIEPYSTTTGGTLITTILRGSGGGETSVASVVGSGAVSSNNSIVDWVLVQLHNPAGTVISQRAALLQRDGDVVDVDGLSPVNMAGNAAGSYFISIKHRNHLAVRSAATIPLFKVTNTNYDFTTGLNKALAPSAPAVNNAMVLLAPNVYGLWAGNTISSSPTTNPQVIRISGPSSVNDATKLIATTGLNIYSISDINLDGSVRSGGPASVNDFTKLISIGAAFPIIYQSIF